jgi:hypothetical protein
MMTHDGLNVANNVIDLEAVRDRHLDELTKRAMKLPRYKRLAILLVACELLRECRRVRTTTTIPKVETLT